MHDQRSADSHVVDAIRRRVSERPGLRHALLAGVRASRLVRPTTRKQVVFVHRLIATGGTNAGNRHAAVGDTDRQRRGGEIAVAVRQGVSEDVVAGDRIAVEASVGVVAVLVNDERAELAGDGEIVRRVRRRHGVDAVHLCDLRVVGALGIGIAVRRIGIEADRNVGSGYDVAGRRKARAHDGIQVVDRQRTVVLELDIQRDWRHRGDGIAIEVRQRALDVQVGGDGRDVVERSRARTGHVIVDRLVLRDPDKSVGVDIDLKDRRQARGADHGATGVGRQHDGSAVQGRQPGSDVADRSSVGVRDRERPGAVLVGADAAREQGALRDHADRRFGKAERSIQHGRMTGAVDIVGRVRVSRGVYAGALVLADLEGLGHDRSMGDARLDAKHLERIAVGESLRITGRRGVEREIVVVADIERVEARCAEHLDLRKVAHAVEHITDLVRPHEDRGRRHRNTVDGEGEGHKVARVGRRDEQDGSIDLLRFRDIDREGCRIDVICPGIGDCRIVGIPSDRQALDELHRQDFRSRHLGMRVVAVDNLAVSHADLAAGGVDGVVALVDVATGQKDVLIVLPVHTADIGIARLQRIGDRFDGRDGRLLRRPRRHHRDIVEHADSERAGAERNAVAIAVGRDDVARKVDKGCVFGVIAGFRAIKVRMIDLILQRKGVRAIGSDREREHFAVAGHRGRIEAGGAVVDVTVQPIRIGDDENVAAVGLQSGVDRIIQRLQSKAARAVRAEIDEGGEFSISRRRRRSRIGAGHLTITQRRTVRVGRRQRSMQAVFVNLGRHVRFGDQRRTIVIEVNLAGDIGGRGRRVAVAILDGDNSGNRPCCQRHLVVRCGGVRMMQRQIFDDRYLAADRIDRNRKCRLTCVTAGIDPAHDPGVAAGTVVLEMKADRAAVRQRHAGDGRIELERIGDGRGGVRTIDAEERQDGQRRAAADRISQHRAGLVRIVARSLDVVEYSQRTGDVVGLVARRLIRRHAKILGDLRRDDRTVVFEANVRRDIRRGRGRVAIAVGDGERCLHLAERIGERHELVDVAVDVGTVVMQRDILNQRNLAAHRIDGDRKGGGVHRAGYVIVGVRPVVTADNQAALEEKKDFLAAGSRKS